MRRVTAVIGAAIACCLLSAIAVNAGFDTPMGGAEIQSQAIPGGSSSHAAFTRNMGQWPDYVLYRAETPEATLWLTSTGVYYQFTRRIESPDTNPGTTQRRRRAVSIRPL
jgi:hypothetical protein